MENPSLVAPENAGTESYAQVLSTIAAEGACPFCPGGHTWRTQQPLHETKNWVVFENVHSYKSAKIRLVVVCKTHYSNPEDLPSDAFAELWDVLTWAIRTYEIEGGGIAMRFGKKERTGSTVDHPHAHIIVPRLYAKGKKAGKAQVVWFPIG